MELASAHRRLVDVASANLGRKKQHNTTTRESETLNAEQKRPLPDGRSLLSLALYDANATAIKIRGSAHTERERERWIPVIH